MGRQRKDPASEILEAVESGAVSVDGVDYAVVRGRTRIRVSHPLAAAAPHLFKPIELHYEVERMTAGPGERRGGE